jgi:type IX secretion system PorP/SprF family membrane protein
MQKKPGLIFVFLFSLFISVAGQETDYGHGFQTMMVNNPAYAGIGDAGTMRLSYLNFYPGNSYNFHSVYVSYDSYFKLLHGGTGIFFSDDYSGGIINDLRGGFCYSYFLQAGKEFYINAGLSASFFHRGFDFSGAVLPDMIDPMGAISLPSSENLTNSGKTLFDAGTGFLFIYRNYYGGIGITHLAEPDMSESGSSTDRIRRKYFANFVADYLLDKRNNLMIKPIAALEIQEDFLSVSAGTVFESNSFSVSTIFFINNYSNIDMQAGFSLKREKMAIFYNYKFSLRSGGSLLPFSLIHQAGLSFNINSLNNVKKSAGVKTINVPEL